MARQVQRKVKRQPSGGRNAVMHQYHDRPWHQLPYWAKDWVYDNAGWVVLALAVLLAPTMAVALTLGFYALPLQFFGIPASANGVGLAAVVLIVKFVLVALAVKPLFRKEIRGWHWLLAAAAVHLAHSVILQHAISGTALFLLTIYLYYQVKARY